ncbi:MAG TPA: SDR family oxidoreductase [Actinomycetota bacterium]|jgi:NAD(P)-dependent dehydrogenase (short-subunit alcohol dehydrogenase family)|nr:SDR family oxidoreductase [Actinomycetota bacterium]
MSDSRRVAVVTGAAIGIGRAIACRLAADGFDMGLTAEQPMDETVARCEKEGVRVVSRVADLTDPWAAEEVVDALVAELGRIDVLVNNAGVTISGPVGETSREQMEMMFAINVQAAWVAIRAAARHMRSGGGGSIVGVSSIHGSRGMGDHSVYAATKGAVDALTRQLAIELAQHAIRVNAVRPGLIETERYFDDPGYDTDRAGRAVPIGRVGTPADVAAAVSFLASPDAGFITGQVLGVDGGSEAEMPRALDVFGD